jgi:non-specific serine/threonine protein kinase
MLAASLPDQSGRLPSPLTPLVGREQEIDAVSDLLHDERRRLVTLIGPGGSGKTRLAIAVAERLYASFANGVAFVPLAAIRDPDLVPSAIAQTLGVREAAGQSLLSRLQAALRDTAMLLVLDNFEQLLPAAPLVSDLLGACPGLAVLVTSRAPLHLYGEHDVLVGPLALPDPARLPPLEHLARVEAVRLFVARTREARSDFVLTEGNSAAVAGICACLDGLPLALELAAARSRLLSPQALLARLEQRLRVLTGGPRDAPARQQTMHATIAWSYDLIDPDQQRLLRQLAVFAGGWTLEAAEVVCEGDTEVLEELDALVDHSLVRQVEQPDGSLRFGMLETIREFGLDQLDLAGENYIVRQRHAVYYLRTFDCAATDWVAQSTLLLARGDAEINNVRGALGWTIEHDTESALRFCHAFHSYWWRRGQFSEARRWMELALAAGQTISTSARAHVLNALGQFATTQGDYAEGRRRCEEALAVFREHDDRLGKSDALFGLGRVAMFTGDYQQALRLLEESRAVAGNPDDSGSAPLANLGFVAIMTGDYARAAGYLDEGLQQARRLNDLAGVALLLALMALLAIHLGDSPRAQELLAESLTLHQQRMPERRYAVQALEYGAWLATVESQPERAARLLGAISTAREAIGVPVPPAIQTQYDQFVPRAAAHITPEAWDQAWSEGAAMTLEEAIDYALQDEPACTPAAAAVPTTLSPRELDVLRLLVDGRSNKEIAAELFISDRTVANHVTNMMNKLGLESRTAVATWATRHGIA